MVTECKALADFVVFQNTDGVFGVFLLKNRKPIENLAFITRVTFEYEQEIVDTAVAPAGTIWWTDQGEYFGTTADILKFKLGNEGLSDGLKQKCRITVYDAINTNGIVYTDSANVEFVA